MMPADEIATLRKAARLAEQYGIKVTATERPALGRVIVRLDKGDLHWVNECRPDDPLDVWLEVLEKGIEYLNKEAERRGSKKES